MKPESQRSKPLSLDTRERLARIETRLDSIATKADLHHEVGAIRQEINAQTGKLVTFVCGFGTALVADTCFIAEQVG